MKKSFILSLLITNLVVISNTFGQAKINMVVTNKPSDSIAVLSQVKQTLIIADKKGVFNKSFEVEAGLHQLKVKDQYAVVYLTNKSDLKITVDYKKFDETLKFSGKVDAVENNFMSKQFASLESDFKNLMSVSNEDDLNKEAKKINDNAIKAIPKNANASFKKFFTDFMAEQTKGITEYIKKSLGNKKINGSDAPPFDYENNKGEKVSLASLKGKLVYIDVWATWCGPCIAEIPSLKKVEALYHDKNIEFVSISVDELQNKEKWKNMVAKKELGGIQLFADNSWNSEFTKAFNINSIPRFILIGADGKVLNSDAPRPSDEKLKALIDANLK